MADTKISAAGDAGVLISTDMVPVARSGNVNAFRATLSEVATYTATAAPVQSVATRTGAVTLTHADITDWASTLAPYAPLASPTFTGAPSLPTGATGVTQAVNNNTTALATTAFVLGQAATVAPLMDGTAAVGTGTTFARVDHAHPSDTTRITQAQGDARYLQLTGGNISGGLAVGGALIGSNSIFSRANTNPSFYLQNATGSTSWGTIYYNNASAGVFVVNQTGACNFACMDGGDLQANPAAGHNFIVNPGIGYQTGGGSWGTLSDARIKTVARQYEHGLAEVVALRPVVYRYKGNAGFDADTRFATEAAEAGLEYVGLVAQDAELVMPEMVGRRAGWIDGERVEDLRDMNTTALTFALVNAVRELAETNTVLRERAEALEARVLILEKHQ